MSTTLSLLAALQAVRDRYQSCALEYSQLEVRVSGARLCERVAADLDAVLAEAEQFLERSKPRQDARTRSGGRDLRIHLEPTRSPEKPRRSESQAIANVAAKTYDPIADARSIAALRAEGGKQ